MGIMAWLGLDDGPKKEPLELNEGNFRQVVGGRLPVVIDAWSPSCAPCRALAPTIMRLAAKYDGRVVVAHVNTAEQPGIAGKLGIMGTPTVLFFKAGRVVERVVGMRGQHYYEEVIEEEFLGGGEGKGARA